MKKARFDPERHYRHSIRLRGRDYTRGGAYFVTMCTYERACLFGAVIDGEMHLNEYGEIVLQEWFRTAELRPHVRLDEAEFVVMPNHVHGIIWIIDAEGRQNEAEGGVTSDESPSPGAKRGSIGAIIARFKGASAKRINLRRGTPGASVWQRGYYDHVIRNKATLHQIRRYIITNPLRWSHDRENLDRTALDELEEALFGPI